MKGVDIQGGAESAVAAVERLELRVGTGRDPVTLVQVVGRGLGRRVQNGMTIYARTLHGRFALPSVNPAVIRSPRLAARSS